LKGEVNWPPFGARKVVRGIQRKVERKRNREIVECTAVKGIEREVERKRNSERVECTSKKKKESETSTRRDKQKDRQRLYCFDEKTRLVQVASTRSPRLILIRYHHQSVY